MSKTEILEVEQADIEQEDTSDVALPGVMGMDAMDSFIETAKKIDEFEKAMNSITNFILRQSYAGDWSCHARETEPVQMRSANLSGAGAERVAKSLGIQETNWNRKEKIWSDDRKSYSYEVEADFSFGKRTVHAYGRASSSDKFFGFSYGKWKELSEVKEDDIKMAAFRNCRKEGVRSLLGLRKIPLLKLRELGYNLDLVHFVNFKSVKDAVAGLPLKTPQTTQESSGASKSEPPKEGKQLFETSFVPKSVEHKKKKDGSPYAVFTDQHGNAMYAWGDDKGNTVSTLLVAMRDGKEVKVEHDITEKNGIMYRAVTKIL